MRESIISIFIVLVLGVFVLIDSAKGQQKSRRAEDPSNTHLGLQLSIETDLTTYTMGAAAKLTVKLKNISKEPIAIYKRFGWGRSSSFSFSVSHENGSGLRRTFIDDHMPSPPFSKDDFLIIQPEENTQVSRWFNIGRSTGITSPGSYRVIVWYHSPVSNEFAPGDIKIWAMENGVLQSKPVTFRVTQ